MTSGAVVAGRERPAWSSAGPPRPSAWGSPGLLAGRPAAADRAGGLHGHPWMQAGGPSPPRSCGAVPLLAYVGWFDVRYHHVGFNTSDGVFLWSRTMTFADCPIIKPPADVRPLCPTSPSASGNTRRSGSGRSAPPLCADAAPVHHADQRAGQEVRPPRHRGPAAGLRQGGAGRVRAHVHLGPAADPEPGDGRAVPASPSPPTTGTRSGGPSTGRRASSRSSTSTPAATCATTRAVQPIRRS